MTLLFKFLSLVIVGRVFSACGSKSLRIISGEEATIWPWMVSLQSVSNNRHFCGGSIIASQYVLSAAHCFENNKTFFVIAGANNLTDPNLIIYEVSSVTLHENYNSTILENDIALIKLTEEITESSKVSTICLPSQADESLIISQNVITSGWGLINPAGSNPSEILYQTTMQIYENSTICPIPPNLHYCAFDPSPKESNVCLGDSGGPLMYSSGGNWYLYGITSFGFINQDYRCLNNFSSYFTKVPRYIDWINANMDQNDSIVSNFGENSTDIFTNVTSSENSTVENKALIVNEKKIFVFILIWCTFFY